MIEGILIGLSTALSIQNLLMVMLGCFFGTIIGMLPGLGPMTAIALMIPITYGFGIAIKSIVGPINFVWARGDENLFDGLDKKENLFYFNFGVKY